MQDFEILKLLFERAEVAITALKDRFSRQIRGIAFNILADHRDVDEVENDTYLALWDTIPPRKPDPLEPYALRTCRNISIRRLRWERAQKRGGSYDLSLDDLCNAMGQHTLEESLDAKLLAQAINNFLDSESEENRVLFLRRHWYGDTLECISSFCGLPPKTISVRLNRIRSRLRNHLIKEGFLIER